VRQVLVVAEDFLATGRTRLYEHDTRVFTSSSDDRPLRHWLTRELLRGQADSARIERTLTLGRSMDLYTQTRDGAWAIKDDARELTGFLLPFAVSFLLAMAILMGSQYLLQGVSEEKESRILESLLCSVTPDELMLGKLLGLGGVGLTLVGAWAAAGLWSSAGVLAMANVTLPASLLLIALAYFVVGYLLYGAVMLTLGALAPNLREATQISSYLILFNVSPFWVATSFMNAPNGPLAVGLSLFPPTAATSMLMRLGTATVSGATIPAWEIALSLTLLTLSALLAVLAGARLFRLGMLLHGKTPNLPTILRLLKTR
jgi:ABC-2 type transport system permease protein